MGIAINAFMADKKWGFGTRQRAGAGGVHLDVLVCSQPYAQVCEAASRLARLGVRRELPQVHRCLAAARCSRTAARAVAGSKGAAGF